MRYTLVKYNEASRNSGCISIRAVKRCHSSLSQQAVTFRHSSYLQPSSAVAVQKHFQMFNALHLKCSSNIPKPFGRQAAAAASGCSLIRRLKHHQTLNSIFLKTSSNIKQHHLARRLRTAFAACLFSNQSQIFSPTIRIFQKRKVLSETLNSNFFHFTLLKNNPASETLNFRCFFKSKIDLSLECYLTVFIPYSFFKSF